MAFQSITNPEKKFGSVYVQRRYDTAHAPAVAPVSAAVPADKLETPLPEGMLEKGNIDLNSRPKVRNADKTYSSEYSTSFSDEDGREILVPTIADGKFLTKDGKKPAEGSKEEKAMFKAAQTRYEDTGEHMGIFKDADTADAYAQAAHSAKRDPFGEPMYVAPAYDNLEEGATFPVSNTEK